MRCSKLFFPTMKEVPVDAEIISHQLMLRAGFIRQVGSGLYTFLPLGVRVLIKIQAIIREEMSAIGAQEIIMPCVQPAELWQQTGRWDDFGPQMLKIKDRHLREYCFGPTHEEVVTDLARREIKSYKQLPFVVFQMTTKFRDEIRPRFGIMRAREFLMKDGYSFDKDEEGMNVSYDNMYSAYHKIFDRLGLKYCVVCADTGAIGGSCSHEFHAMADCGEDTIAYAEHSNYAANIELATCSYERPGNSVPVDKPVKVPADQSGEVTVRTCAVLSGESVFFLVIAAADEINDTKVSNLKELKSGWRFLTPEEIQDKFSCTHDYVGPYLLPEDVAVILDNRLLYSSDSIICGANECGYRWVNIDAHRDLSGAVFADIRKVAEGDLSPDGGGPLHFCRGIEVGHIFQLGRKYSRAMSCSFVNEEQGRTEVFMGCYGIGISRILAATVEQCHDDKGIIWPREISPFQVIIITIGSDQDSRVSEMAERLYKELVSLSLDVLYDDRQLRAGVKLKDADIIGIPDRLVISPNTIANGCVEYQERSSADRNLIPTSDIGSYLLSLKR
ncbi:proline--tRNA ligase [Candidatus Ichthyocystis hellenicum]|uniref:proline--tRNA ligase n=1 Tax=Candidatus Ichthyocystis hellenicum TaxID=1561003 RepID=UPI000B2730A0|nr:proline--tRNA ligase [Candidatus Ichthyocystis hellenicum]